MDKFYHSVRLNPDLCKGCINCIKRCPTEAIRVRDGKACIISERCIDCGECIRVCPHHAKRAQYDSLSALDGFEYKIALPAPTLYGQFNHLDDIDIVLTGLKRLGFDDVFEVARAAELVSEATRRMMREGKLRLPVISSACPAVVRLIRVRFPDLCSHVLPLGSPMEFAARLAKDEADFYQRLDKIMDLSARSLKIKRDVITKLMEAGLYPYTKRYLGTFDNHFSTIGLIGMNEVGLNAKWLRADLTHPETQVFAQQVLDHMRERLSDYQEQYGDLYNLEATPAESTTYRLAKHDVERWPDIITAAKPGDTPYYTNSSHLPVGYTEDIFSALAIQDDLQTRYTSGTVFHAFLGEKLPDWQAAAALVRKIAENFKLPYYTISPTYSICPEHGYITGEHFTCPVCGGPAEVYSRITGYYRPVQNWNNGKAQEFKDRKLYDIPNSHIEGKRLCDREGTAAQQPTAHSEKTVSAAISAATPADELLLFTTQTCPNCPGAKAALDQAGILYQAVDAREARDLTRRYHVFQAPTLVIRHGDQIETIAGASGIREYARAAGTMAQ